MRINGVKSFVSRALLAVAFLGGGRGFAQRSVEYVAPGSTVYGDAKRGEAQFLKGLAWYELHSARARSIEAATQRANEEWLRKSYEFDQAQRAARIQRKNFRTQQAYEARLRETARNEERWRSSPTERDVLSGDALNALLLDLSNPTIPPSAWRYAGIDLPAETSIRSLVFRFIPKLQDKGSQVLGGSLIALGRLDSRNWSSTLSGKELEKEVKDYQDVYEAVIAQSVAGRIDFQTILKMDAALAAVEAKARTEIPTERNYQATALAALRDVKAATKMFDAETLDFVREIIADTNAHDAQTVGELVAFMRKYRLAFADVQKSPSGGEAYHDLYRLMREQKEKLGVGSSHAVAGADDPSRNAPSEGAAAATITAGRWRIDGQDLLLDSVGEDEFCVFGDPSWSDYDIEFQARVVRGKEGFVVRIGQAEDDRYAKAGFGTYSNHHHVIQITTPQDAHKILARLDGSVDQTQTYSVKISMRGKTIRSFLNGGKILEATDDRFTPGRVGVGAYFTSVRFRNIVVTSASGQVLFKGPPELPGATASRPSAATDLVRAGSVWSTDVRSLTILERDGERFRARFESPTQIRDVTGRIAGNEIVWLGRDVVAVRGGPGDDNFGVIRGDELDLKWGTYRGRVKGEFRLKLQR